MGDIHGTYKALQQCFARSGFNKRTHRLIQLGDVTDSYGEVYECVEELLGINHLVAVKGNHDDWFTTFINTGAHPYSWQQGGMGTAASYFAHSGITAPATLPRSKAAMLLTPGDIPAAHRNFFINQRLYFVDEHNNCFVHGGFNRLLPFYKQQPDVYFWDRSLWSSALSARPNGRLNMVTPFNHIYLGHTPTINWLTDKPMQAVNITNLDTGAGHNGRLTIMHLPTGQYWQSDPVKELYDESYR